MTGTYRFQTGSFGLIDTQAEFHKAMDFNLIGLTKYLLFLACVLGDILIVSK